MPPSFCNWLQLLGQVFEIEGALLHALGDLLGLVVVDVQGGPFDQADHVAHAEDAAGDALGVEVLEAVELFAGAHQLDRLAGDGAHGEGGTAAAIAVDAGQHDAGNADLLVEGAGEIDRVLAGQRIGDEQRFIGLGDVAHGGRFGEEFLVDVKPAGGIEHDHVVAALAGFRHGAPGDLRPGVSPLTMASVSTFTCVPENGELLLRGGAAGVERGHQNLALVALGQALGDLGGGGGLAGALQADHQDRQPGGEARRLRAEPSEPSVSTSASWTILTTIWPGLIDLTISAPTALSFTLSVKVRTTSSATSASSSARRTSRMRRIDIGLRQRTAAGELVEYAGQALA